MDEAQIEALLTKLGLQKGAPTMSVRQLRNRIRRFTESAWPWSAREQFPDQYAAWGVQHAPAIAAAQEAFGFNHQLATYRAAVARLDQYPLAQGRVAIYEYQPTGEFDEEGNPITESVLVSPQIDPLPTTITQDIRDPGTGEIIGTEEVPNLAIVQDEAERAAQQAVIDNTPQAVKDFDND